MIFTQIFEEFDSDSRQNRWGEQLWTGAPVLKLWYCCICLNQNCTVQWGHTLIDSSTRVLMYNTTKTLETRRCQVVSANRTWTLSSQIVSQNNATIHRSMGIQVPSQIPQLGRVEWVWRRDAGRESHETLTPPAPQDADLRPLTCAGVENQPMAPPQETGLQNLSWAYMRSRTRWNRWGGNPEGAGSGEAHLALPSPSPSPGHGRRY